MRSKYRSKKVKVGNLTFDSKKEYNRYQQLILLQRSGSIKDLKLQPKYEIIPTVKWNGKTLRKVFYIADFQYIQDGVTVVEDVKGFKTDVYQLKKRLFIMQNEDIKFIET